MRRGLSAASKAACTPILPAPIRASGFAPASEPGPELHCAIGCLRTEAPGRSWRLIEAPRLRHAHSRPRPRWPQRAPLPETTSRQLLRAAQLAAEPVRSPPWRCRNHRRYRSFSVRVPVADLLPPADRRGRWRRAARLADRSVVLGELDFASHSVARREYRLAHPQAVSLYPG